MALYDYSCGICNKTITVTRSITDSEEFSYCETCSEPLKRVYSSNVGVQFNGSGFYSNDK